MTEHVHTHDAMLSTDPHAVCEIGIEHRPRPLRLVVHHLLPRAAGGHTTAANTRVLCDTDHMAVHLLLFYAATHDGALPPRKGNRAQRELAIAGYDAAVAAGTVDRIPDEGTIT